MSHHEFYIGDNLNILKRLNSGTVQCVVTSPPYWGLRDYQSNGQIGLEETVQEYIDKLVKIFDEIWRVLRDDGTVWLNLGDSYCSTAPGTWGDPLRKRGPFENITEETANARKRFRPNTPQGLKPKDLIGIPWRIAFTLQEAGWYLRSDIVWNKPNCMPESVRDRPTRAHEYVFLLTKISSYYYDSESIKEPATTHFYDKRYTPGASSRNRKNETWNQHAPNKPHNGFKKLDTTNGRNKRSVWTVPTRPFKEAHFATFPPDLIEPCILAGTSPKTCPVCGAPWKRVIKKTGHKNNREPAHVPNNNPTKIDSTGWAPTSMGTGEFQPGCSCEGNNGTGRSIVLDPFGGAGTTTLVAKKHGRDSIYIDISKKYADMAIKRNGFLDNGLFETDTYKVIS